MPLAPPRRDGQRPNPSEGGDTLSKKDTFGAKGSKDRTKAESSQILVFENSVKVGKRPEVSTSVHGKAIFLYKTNIAIFCLKPLLSESNTTFIDV